jgi:hypothetical protein
MNIDSFLVLREILGRTAGRRNVGKSSKFIVRIAMLLFTMAPSAAFSQGNGQPEPCLYAFEWLHTFRFPLQPDPHASYSYVLPKQPTDGTPLGFLVEGEFPYAVWFSWTIYGAQGKPTSLVSDTAVVPEPGNVNPFIVGAHVLDNRRHYRMLLLPQGATAGSSLGDVPNHLTLPGNVATATLAYRVYQAFPGHNQGGSSGATRTPFPAVFAVNYKTGEKLSCSAYNAVPASIGRLPADTPNIQNLYGTDSSTAAEEASSFMAPEGGDSMTQEASDLPSTAAIQAPPLPIPLKFEFAPQIDPALVTFTRPPLAAGADVSSIPPPDNCSGYLGARLNPRRISIIRIPQVPTVFDPLQLNRHTRYPDAQGAYFSLVMYGAAIATYAPGKPFSASLADSELQPDFTGGATLVVWPRDLPIPEREQLFAYARANGWALVRNGRVGALTTANMLIRLKGASSTYYGAYTALPGVRTGVPCYFNGAPDGTPWTAIETANNPMTYVASFQNLGNAAPQGVQCTSTADVLNGSCLFRLKDYIRQTGGQYFNPGNVPPP